MFQRRKTKSIHSKNTRDDFRKSTNHSEEEGLLNRSFQSPISGSGSPFSPLSPLSSFSRVLSISSPQSVDRSHHSLERLPQDLFRISNTQMKELNLSSNNLNLLPRNFYNLVRLVRLNLSDNQLVRLSSEIELLSNLELSIYVIVWSTQVLGAVTHLRVAGGVVYTGTEEGVVR